MNTQKTKLHLAKRLVGQRNEDSVIEYPVRTDISQSEEI